MPQLRKHTPIPSKKHCQLHFQSLHLSITVQICSKAVERTHYSYVNGLVSVDLNMDTKTVDEESDVSSILYTKILIHSKVVVSTRYCQKKMLRSNCIT